MAKNLQVDDTVYVPISKIKNYKGPTSSSLVRGRVLSVERASVDVKIYSREYKSISKKYCRTDICVLLMTIGDFETEDELLDPLGKSALSYLRLLLSDDQVKAIRIRTLEEIRIFWEKNHSTITHVVTIGHGEDSGLVFATRDSNESDKDVGAKLFMSQFRVDGVTPKTFINLSCHTGMQKFASPASSFYFCESFIGPYKSVHGATASQFLQTFFVFHFLEAYTVSVAFRHARERLKRVARFRCWQNGKQMKKEKEGDQDLSE